MVFDLDGTLVDSRLDLAVSVNAALRAVGLPERPPQEIFGFIGEGARRLVERSVAPRLELLEPALDHWSRHYADHLLDATRAYPGIPELLERLRPPLAVHTNKPGGFARRILEGLGLAGRFARVVGGGDGWARKPDPAGALALLGQLGVSPGRAVYVGDSRIDVATARTAGMRFIGVAWGLGGERELREAGAVEIVASVPELAAALVLK
ncbi:MAG: HAD family hydrolase [Myxococcales bacterium]